MWSRGTLIGFMTVFFFVWMPLLPGVSGFWSSNGCLMSILRGLFMVLAVLSVGALVLFGGDLFGVWQFPNKF